MTTKVQGYIPVFNYLEPKQEETASCEISLVDSTEDNAKERLGTE